MYELQATMKKEGGERGGSDTGEERRYDEYVGMYVIPVT